MAMFIKNNSIAYVILLFLYKEGANQIKSIIEEKFNQILAEGLDVLQEDINIAYTRILLLVNARCQGVNPINLAR